MSKPYIIPFHDKDQIWLCYVETECFSPTQCQAACDGFAAICYSHFWSECDGGSGSSDSLVRYESTVFQKEDDVENVNACEENQKNYDERKEFAAI